MYASLNNVPAALGRCAQRVFLAATLTAGSFSALATEPAAEPKTIAVMNFELIDNTGETTKDAEQKARLGMISRQLREALAEHHLYTVVDNAPAHALITDLESRFALHDCNGCESAYRPARPATAH